MENFEAVAARLSDPELSVQAKNEIAQTLKLHIEIVHTFEYARFLSVFMNVFDHLLNSVEPAFDAASQSHMLRNNILGILQRLPYNESLKPYAPDLLRLVMNVLRVDNEENAAISLRVIIELHKNFRSVPALEEQVTPFFDIFKEMLRGMERNVDTFVDRGTFDMVVDNVDGGGESNGRAGMKSLESFKVLSECPIILVLLFQIYKKFITPNIAELVPLILHTISVRAKAQIAYTKASTAECVTGTSPAIVNKTVYAEFIAAQVKIMSFLAYIIRGYTATIKPHQQLIASSTINLLIDCPMESSATRKELLVAARHILSTDFRVAFLPYISILFHENVLIGDGITSRETLRPLAFSMLADLIHHVRQDLTREQISQTIVIYTQNLHDPTLAASIQTMCSKLLLNMIDCIVAEQDKDLAKKLLVRILDSFAAKFASLKLVIEKLIARQQAQQNLSNASSSGGAGGAVVVDVVDDIAPEHIIDVEHMMPIRTSTATGDHYQTESFKDYKFLFKTLSLGLKTIIFGLNNIQNPAGAAANGNKGATPAQVTPGAYKRLPLEEVELYASLFTNGMLCFRIFQLDTLHAEQPVGAVADASSAAPNAAGSPLATNAPGFRTPAAAKEEKEVLEHFVTIFTFIDPAVFHEVFQTRIEFFFERLMEDPAMLAIPQYLLASEAVSRSFSSVVLHFLMDRLDKLGGQDVNQSTLMLRLFKLVFMAVTLYPDSNESVLQPHIASIITRSMKESSKVQEPNNYFLLMRALFRNIGGGRFELLYKEVLPLLPFLLKSLNALLAVADKSQMRDLFVELCLTVPVRLSVLLPHLHHLMRPLVLSLRASSELVSQGLRTLELCIDNLTSEFLDPILAPVINELMPALWSHLKPSPYNQSHSHATMRILGKLGGRNRRMLKEIVKFDYKDARSSALTVSIMFEPNKVPFQISVEEALQTATQTLRSGTDSLQAKEHAFRMLVACLGLFIDCEDGGGSLGDLLAAVSSNGKPETKEALQKHFSDYLKNRTDTTPVYSMDRGYPTADCASDGGDPGNRRACLKRILGLVFLASTVEGAVGEEAKAFSMNLATHFALIKVMEGAGFTSPKPELMIDSNVFLDEVIDSMTGDTPEVRRAVEEYLVRFAKTLGAFSSADEFAGHPAFAYLASKFCSACYQPEWFKKIGGSRGFNLLIEKMNLGVMFVLEHQLEFVRALLFVFKDMSNELASGSISEIRDTLFLVIRNCNFVDSVKDETDRRKQSAKLVQLLTFLVSELSNSNETVRVNVQSSLALIAELTGHDVYEMLQPFKDRLVGPIFSKPLRALPFSMQIGNIDAISYALTLSTPLLELNDELVRLIQEAFALADADDHALASKSSQYKNADILVKLRISCVKFLSIVLSLNELSSAAKFTNIRLRIAQLFFKSMYSKSPEVVDAAKHGLRHAVSQQNKIPKELLSTGLRPILLDLSEYRRVSVEGLVGLGRLLEMLNSYFKVEIGQKLLDHLQKWAAPAALENASFKPLSESQEVKIIAGILEVIHLLPAGAVMFLEEMMRTVLKLEAVLRRSLCSPFRDPLAKFVNRYPSESFEYFLKNVGDFETVRLFVALIDNSNAPEFQKFVVNSVPLLIQAGFDDEAATPVTRVAVTFIIGRMVATLDATFLLTFPSVVDVLLLELRVDSSMLVPQEIDADLIVLYHRARIASVLIAYLKLVPDNVEIVYDLIDMLNSQSTVDFSFVKVFLYEHFSLRAGFDAALVTRFLAELCNGSVDVARKISIIRLLIVPMLTVALRKEPADKIFGADLKNNFVRTVIVSFSSTPAAFAVEALQLCALILKNVPQVFYENRKDVIKYAWAFMKNDDPITRQATYVVLAYFIREYETLPKIITQIFLTLLKSYQSECRLLVKQALDVLIPALPVRLSQDDGDPPCPTWIRWTRKVLIDDGHLLPQMISIWQIVVRHSGLFYGQRELFVQHMAASLNKLGFTPSATSDTKNLTLDLIEVLLKWEQQRVSENPPSVNVMMDVDDALQPTQSFAASSAIKEIVVNYMIRFLCISNEPFQRRGRVWRILKLLESFAEQVAWQDVNVKMSFVEKYFASVEINESTVAHIPHVLTAIGICTAKKSPAWFGENVAHFQGVAERCLASEDVKVIDGMTTILDTMFQSCKDNSTVLGLMASLTQFLQAQVTENLQANRNLYGAVTSLRSICVVNASFMEQAVAPLSRVLFRTAKEMSSGAVTSSGPVNVLIINNALQLLNSCLANLGDNKKTFFSAMAVLIEKATDATIHATLLEMISGWVFSDKGAPLTIKEKSLVLLKFSSLENRCGTALFEEYLTAVLRIYKEDRFARSELTVRLEPIFLIGTRSPSPDIRQQFIRLFDKNLPKNLFGRVSFICGVQNWEFLGAWYWIKQAVDILLAMGRYDVALRAVGKRHSMTFPLTVLKCSSSSAKVTVGQLGDSGRDTLLEQHKKFLAAFREMKVGDILKPIRYFLHSDSKLAASLWRELFPLAWLSFSTKERHDMNKYFVALLSKEYHLRQSEQRPNVVSALIESAALCETPTPMLLPPQILKYTAKHFNTWHTSLVILESQLQNAALVSSLKDYNKVKELAMDALGDIYAQLGEDDLFFGMWRRRCLYPETNAALSFEQIGMWKQAQSMYENAQMKARNGLLPLLESEYCLWEDHWIACTQKLQQWDLCSDLAKHDGNVPLQLECAWRIVDWNAERESLNYSVQLIADNPTPRQKVFEAFLILTGMQQQPDGHSADKLGELQRVCDEGIQILLKNWHALPGYVGAAHIPLLNSFQQFVEIQEASHVYLGVASSAPNKMQAVQELKGTLGTWRDRLPNLSDDVNIWSELVAWRQHVFTVINKAYQPLADQQQQGQQGAMNSLAYRGYHEIAWIINRFAHVARKHHMTDVCMNALAKIYTLPNIEIHDAFLKLREQAKCYFDNTCDDDEALMMAGLEVINNTNLGYFQQSQRAEFFALKGIFLGKLGMNEEASAAFSTAIQVDVNLPKGWSAWALFNDRRFMSGDTSDLVAGADAVNCYLHAAGIYKNHRSRKYIARVLWILGMDSSDAADSDAAADQESPSQEGHGQGGIIARAFDLYKGEVPTWYWITFIPHLLESLGRVEARHAKNMLIRIAKTYPQALYLALRTVREDFRPIRIQQQASTTMGQDDSTAAAQSPLFQQQQQQVKESTETMSSLPDDGADDVDMDDDAAATAMMDVDQKNEETASASIAASSAAPADDQEQQQSVNTPVRPFVKKKAWEHVEDVMAILKTAYPLLALSMETVTDQLITQLKPTTDEDVYRIVCALLQDALQVYFQGLDNGGDGGGSVEEKDDVVGRMISAIERFVHTPLASTAQQKLTNILAGNRPSLQQLIVIFREWRDRLTDKLSTLTCQMQQLENFSHYLVEFEHQRFDDVEMFGQYLLPTKNSNADFVKIERLLPLFQVVRGHDSFSRRLTFQGHDGTMHTFALQIPSSRHARREERLGQLFRCLGAVLDRRVECRRRGLGFNVPLVVALSPVARLLQDEESEVSLLDVYEKWCHSNKVGAEDYLDVYGKLYETGLEKLGETHSKMEDPSGALDNSDQATSNKVRLEIFDHFTATASSVGLFPDTILAGFIQKSMASFTHVWMFRQRFIGDYAAMTFMHHLASIGHRLPHKIRLCLKNGSVSSVELLPLMNASQLVLECGETVPFRLTPNVQRLMGGGAGIEGPFVGALVSLAWGLSEHESVLDAYLPLFVKEELLVWRQMLGNSAAAGMLTEGEFVRKIGENVDVVKARVDLMACKAERGRKYETTLPVCQSVLEMVSEATSPVKLSGMDPVWMPWF